MNIEKIAEYRATLVNQSNTLNSEVQRMQVALEQAKNNAIATSGAIQALDILIREDKESQAAAAPATPEAPTPVDVAATSK
jgi:hypothetical protein